MKGNVGEQEVLEALRGVAAGRQYFCPTSQKVRSELLDDSLHVATPLTPRQLAIAKLVAAGKTSHAIAGELNLSPHTVENHRADILRKLKVRNAAELATCVNVWG